MAGRVLSPGWKNIAGHESIIVSGLVILKMRCSGGTRGHWETAFPSREKYRRERDANVTRVEIVSVGCV